MSEFTLKPSGTNQDPANLDWANGAINGVDYIEPPPAKRDAAWLFQEKPPYNYFNWFWRLVSLMVTWLTAWKIRAYDALETPTASEANGGVADGHIFILGRPTGYVAPFSEVWSVAGGGGVGVDSVAVDGQYVYYTQDDELYRVGRYNGLTVLAQRVLNAGNDIEWIFADGARVVAGIVSNAGAEVYAVDRETLADLPSFPIDLGAIGAQHVTSNGDVWVVAEDNGSNDAQTYNAAGGFSTLNHLADVRRVAVDYERAYIAGDDAGGGIQLRSFLGFAGAADWSVAFPKILTVNDMVSDGDQLFLCFDDDNVGPNRYNVASYDRQTGALNWLSGAPDLSTTDNAVSLCVDDAWLYVAAGNFLYQLSKLTGAVVRKYDHGGLINAVSCDGDCIIIGGEAGTGGNRLRRLNRGGGSRMFVKGIGTDPNRPYAKLAIPVERN